MIPCFRNDIGQFDTATDIELVDVKFEFSRQVKFKSEDKTQGESGYLRQCGDAFPHSYFMCNDKVYEVHKKFGVMNGINHRVEA